MIAIDSLMYILGLIGLLVLNHFARKKAYLDGVVFGCEDLLIQLEEQGIIKIDDSGRISPVQSTSTN